MSESSLGPVDLPVSGSYDGHQQQTMGKARIMARKLPTVELKNPASKKPIFTFAHFQSITENSAQEFSL